MKLNPQEKTPRPQTAGREGPVPPSSVCKAERRLVELQSAASSQSLVREALGVLEF